ncbi:uncharacterized protein LOC116260741 isoform X2 [Nymphaea colorata]|uniref:uncharacterized protein LOC116260741 isoform X2 n=1 Tax=Nymphaea colorata TaxID=210225 RepID=UPI00129D57CD|nr:uncharacterized protein LOC116260741 isoform X2 [Nymphaea colorata]
MIKGAKWRSHKNKIKAVFRMQFQATQVPPLGSDSLMVALVSSETGKTTAKTQKVQVQNGSCQWDNPVYETVKLAEEERTGKFDSKIYQFVVSNGLSKGGVLGKAALDLAEFVDALKPCSVSLSLGSSNSTILRITIQRLNADGDTRGDKRRKATVRTPDRNSLSSYMDDVDSNGTSQTSTCNSNAGKDTSAANGAIQYSPSMINTAPHIANCDSNLKVFGRSGATSASSSSESSSGHEFFNECKLGSNGHSPAINCLPSPVSNTKLSVSENSEMAEPRESEDTITEQSLNWITNEIRQSSIYTSKEIDLNQKLQLALSSIETLKDQIAVMGRQAEVTDLEVQTLRKQIVKENRKVQEFSREICNMKEERDALEQEYEELKGLLATNNNEATNGLQHDDNDPSCILEEVKQELAYERDLNANLRLQLKKTQDANFELILAVQDLENMLDQKDEEITCVCISRCSTPPAEESSSELESRDELKDHQNQSLQFPKNIENEQEKEQPALEVPSKKHDDTDDMSPFEQSISGLKSQTKECKKDRDILEMQMGQLALDYEILKQENHDLLYKLEQFQIQEQLKMQHDTSVSATIINDLEIHVDNLEKELAQQQETFEAALAAVSHVKVEQEQRAIRAEDLLRKTRQSNADTAERLVEEFRKLSMQMSVAFETNEKLAMQAMSESSDLLLKKNHLEELLTKSSKELQLVKDQYEEKLGELSGQLDSEKREINQQLLEIECLTREVKEGKETSEVTSNALSDEILSLKADIQMLQSEKNTLVQKIEEKENIIVEMEKMRIKMNENDAILQREEAERKILQEQVLLAREETKELLEELNEMRHLLVEKEEMLLILRSEKEKITVEYNGFKSVLLDDEVEKENLKKQVSQLRNDLKKKEQTITTIEKKIKDNSSRVVAPTGNTKASLRNNKSISGQQRIKEVFKLQEKIKLLEEEVKIKEITLENSRTEFAEKERDLNARIEELHKNTSNQALDISDNSKENIQENVFDTESKENNDKRRDISVKSEEETVAHFQESQHQYYRLSGKLHEKENMGTNENGMVMKMETLADMLEQAAKEHETKSIASPWIEQEIFTQCTSDQDGVTKLITEIAQLKKKNASMEDELKDMQERYSDISLKFAEVEGERQQLVMTIRNLKNAKKS